MFLDDVKTFVEKKSQLELQYATVRLYKFCSIPSKLLNFRFEVFSATVQSILEQRGVSSNQ